MICSTRAAHGKNQIEWLKLMARKREFDPVVARTISRDCSMGMISDDEEASRRAVETFLLSSSTGWATVDRREEGRTWVFV